MSAANSVLPKGFEALEPFVDYWAVAPAALEYLDKKPLGQFDEKERRLMNLVCSLVHAAYAVEIQAENEPRHAQLRNGLKITRATADFGFLNGKSL